MKANKIVVNILSQYITLMKPFLSNLSVKFLKHTNVKNYDISLIDSKRL